MRSKIIVTNLTALKKKYLDQVFQIQAALTPILAADKAQNINTTVIYIDDAAQMRVAGGVAVTDPANEQQNKAAIDALCAHYNPNYILILGSIDIIPHQSLNNPVPQKSPVNPGGDPDPDVPSDLPYACTAAYSREIRNFIAPTRVVGRLPDLTGIPSVGSKDTTYLLGLMSNVVDRSKFSVNTYKDYFSISTAAWLDSTKLSLRNMFGYDANIAVSPPDGPNWTKAQTRKLSHFINCHGANNNPNFYGDDGAKPKPNQPICMSAGLMENNITFGTIAAAECCYGAQLYNPDSPIKQHMGLCSTYLEGGCLAYFGSSNVAYGPSTGNGTADIITQEFIKELLLGNDAGTACLNARLTFIRTADRPLKPTSLKTIAQFNLLGDPVMSPVSIGPAPLVERDESLYHINLMKNAIANAFAITQSVGWVEYNAALEPSARVLQKFQEICKEQESEIPEIYSYEVKWPESLPRSFEALNGATAVHAITIEKSTLIEGMKQYIVFEITEAGREILDIKEYHSK